MKKNYFQRKKWKQDLKQKKNKMNQRNFKKLIKNNNKKWKIIKKKYYKTQNNINSCIFYKNIFINIFIIN